MSNNNDKIKHSTRRTKNHDKVVRQLKIARSHGINIREPHRLSKHHSIDFSDDFTLPRHQRRKLLKEKTIQEKRFLQIRIKDEEAVEI